MAYLLDGLHYYDPDTGDVIDLGDQETINVPNDVGKLTLRAEHGTINCRCHTMSKSTEEQLDEAEEDVNYFAEKNKYLKCKLAEFIRWYLWQIMSSNDEVILETMPGIGTGIKCKIDLTVNGIPYFAEGYGWDQPNAIINAEQALFSQIEDDGNEEMYRNAVPDEYKPE